MGMGETPVSLLIISALELPFGNTSTDANFMVTVSILYLLSLT